MTPTTTNSIPSTTSIPNRTNTPLEMKEDQIMKKLNQMFYKRM